jgi:tetratricopeptide (TPR) repeat protein
MLVRTKPYVSLCLLVALLTGAPSLYAQTADELDQQAALSIKNLKEEDALNLYKQALVVQPDNLIALIGASDMSSRVGARMVDKSKDQAAVYFSAAQDYASKALKVDSNSSDANVVMAIALGRLSLIESGKKKVQYARDIKMYCDKSIKINPQNYRAYYVLGKWNFEIANLNYFERSAAKMFFGGIPDGSIKGAIINFEKCRQLNPGFILNYLDLSNAYKQDDQNEKALGALQTLVHLPVQAEDDPATKMQGKKLLDAMM